MKLPSKRPADYIAVRRTDPNGRTALAVLAYGVGVVIAIGGGVQAAMTGHLVVPIMVAVSLILLVTRRARSGVWAQGTRDRH